MIKTLNWRPKKNSKKFRGHLYPFWNGGKFYNRTVCGVATTPPQRPRKGAERFLAFEDPFSKEGALHSVSHSRSVHNMPILVLQTKNEK